MTDSNGHAKFILGSQGRRNHGPNWIESREPVVRIVKYEPIRHLGFRPVPQPALSLFDFVVSAQKRQASRLLA